MPWKEKPSKPNLLIVQSPYILRKAAMKHLHDRLVKEIKTGVVCLPVGANAKFVSGNVRAKTKVIIAEDWKK